MIVNLWWTWEPTDEQYWGAQSEVPKTAIAARNLANTAILGLETTKYRNQNCGFFGQETQYHARIFSLPLITWHNGHWPECSNLVWDRKCDSKVNCTLLHLFLKSHIWNTGFWSVLNMLLMQLPVCLKRFKPHFAGMQNRKICNQSRAKNNTYHMAFFHSDWLFCSNVPFWDAI